MPTVANPPMTIAVDGLEDILTVRRFRGREALSQLSWFEAHCTVPPPGLLFGSVLGRTVTFTLPLWGAGRYFQGICNYMCQVVDRYTDPTYQIRIVPRAWLLTRRVRSRIFEHWDVASILADVFKAANFTVSATGDVFLMPFRGTHRPHEYCVQYQESDWDFVNRLMEEEGICYFFQQTEGGPQMVITDLPSELLCKSLGETMSVAAPTGMPGDNPGVVYSWAKSQVLGAARYVVREHHFALGNPILEAGRKVADDVTVGTVKHPLRFPGLEDVLEVADYPGEYNHRFDDVSVGGGDQPAALESIYNERDDAVKLRMQQETVQGLRIDASSCNHLMAAGCWFTLIAPAEHVGKYLITEVVHAAEQSGDRSGGLVAAYSNSFGCLPLSADFPFRPARVTPRPVIAGPQTALVVGTMADGDQRDEIFTDKFGRVKVQFHWDRLGEANADSSCWVRVGTPWAGKHWGMIHLPRVGHEVIVAFQDGNPDMPIIVGSVYNHNNPTPWKLPEHSTRSGVKSRSSLHDPNEDSPHFNELYFEDQKGAEDVHFRAEKDFHRVVNNDDELTVGRDQGIHIQHDHKTVIDNEEQHVVKGRRMTKIEKLDSLHVDGTDYVRIEANYQLDVFGRKDVEKDPSDATDQGITIYVKEGDDRLKLDQGKRTVEIKAGNDELTITKGTRKVAIKTGNDELTISQGNQTITITGKSATEASESIVLKVGTNSIKIEPSGITISGLTLKLEGLITTEVKAGVMTTLKADAMLQAKGGVVMIG